MDLLDTAYKYGITLERKQICNKVLVIQEIPISVYQILNAEISSILKKINFSVFFLFMNSKPI